MDLESQEARTNLISVEMSWLDSDKQAPSCKVLETWKRQKEFFVEGPDNLLYYCGKTSDPCVISNCGCEDSYLVSKDSMACFLETAARDIQMHDDLQQDPLLRLNTLMNTYTLCLAAAWTWTAYSAYLLLDFMNWSEEEMKIKMHDVKGISEALTIIFTINLITQIAMICTGVYSMVSWKIPAFKYHAYIAIGWAFTTMPWIFLNKLSILCFIFLNFCYFRARKLESVLYNGLVYGLLGKIEDVSEQRSHFELFRWMKHSACQTARQGQFDVMPSGLYTLSQSRGMFYTPH